VEAFHMTLFLIFAPNLLQLLLIHHDVLLESARVTKKKLRKNERHSR
jgi:hypothetical protein